MKKIFTYLYAIIMAALVFYGGAGINIVSYCCNQCRSAGIEVLREDVCCEIHNHSHHRSGNSCNDLTGTTCGDLKNRHVAAAGENVNHDDCRNHRENYDGDNGFKCPESGYCNMERIDFDWYSQLFPEWDIKLSPVVFDLSPYESIDFSYIFICEAGWSISKGPPAVNPRDYLSCLTILLI